MKSQVSVNLIRRDDKEPWGLRIAGGRDFGAPVTIQRVVPNGVADRGGLQVGDRLTQIEGQDAAEMCHRDAQLAIKTAGNNLRLEVERSSTSLAPKSDAPVTTGLQQLEIRGSAPSVNESVVDAQKANSTAKPWETPKSFDGRASDTSGFRPISSRLPSQSPVAPSAEKDVSSHENSSSLPSSSNASNIDTAPVYRATFNSRTQPGRAPPISSDGALQESGLRRTDHAPYRHQAPTAAKVNVENSSHSALHDSGLRKTDHAPFRYQPPESIEAPRKSSVPATSSRYQPSTTGHRASEPNVTPFQKDFQRKGSDCFPVPFSASFKPASTNGPPAVLPKPHTERRMSYEREQPPPNSNDSPPSPVAQETTPKDTKNEKTPAVCYHCKEVIRGPYLMALDRFYCPDHFRCAKCNVQLGKQPFISHQGKVYCLDDYRQHIAPRCAKCGDPVEEQQLLALEKVYHPQCFVCNMCKKPMAKGSFRIGTDNMPYCEEDWKKHFQVICGRCNFPIEADEQFIDAMSKNYHVDCFVCTTCHTKLEGKAFYLRNDQPYCKEHIQSAR